MTVLFVNHDELNFTSIGNFFKSCNPWWIAAAFACILLSTLFEGLSLHVIARYFGYKPRLVSSVAYSAADSFYSALTPSASGGQPAAAFYMARDGMPIGKASFGLVFNLICYTVAIFVMGLIALCINPSLFLGIDGWLGKTLIIFGVVVNCVLLALSIGCIFFGKIILKAANGIITLFVKIKIIKNEQKWRDKVASEVEKYAACRHILKSKPLLIISTMILNILQRATKTLLPCFVCLAADPDAPLGDLIVLQVFVLYGYNSIPLPGGVGAYEYLFLQAYSVVYGKEFVLVALMISRLISYYINMLISGVYTLVYHLVPAKPMAVKDGIEQTEQPPSAEECEEPPAENIENE